MSEEAASFEARSATLRKQLKYWESSFAASHHGRKASRDEIKSQPDIVAAVKYKEYNHLRDVLSGKAPVQASHHTPRKRKARSALHTESPSKQRRTVDQPNPGGTTVVIDDNWPLAGSPANDLTPSARRSYVGPTPQKDGRVLGLFDLLPSEQTTPSRHTRSRSFPSQDKARAVLGLIDDNPQVTTPRKSKPSSQQDEVGKENTPLTACLKHSRTPQSEGKRFVLDMFVTPSKRKRDMEPEHIQEQSAKSFGFSTPAFLKRRTVHDISLPTIAEEDAAAAGGAEHGVGTPSGRKADRGPSLKPLGFRRTLGRSFSSLIAEVRKAENDRLDDEMDVLHEMEEQDGNSPPPAKAQKVVPALQVEDSQMALGPDGTHDYSEDEKDDPLQKPSGKVWKKKGAKRQTRRVTLRPTIKQKPKVDDPQRATFLDSGSSPSSDVEHEQGSLSKADDAGGATIIQETQLPFQFSATTSDTDDEDSQGSEYADDDKTDFDGTSRTRKSESSTAALKTTSGPDPQAEVQEPATKSSIGNQVKKAARKVNQAAHANYRRLNIRSKGGAGKKGRFGRRR
ncbi:MAG: regulatory particle non-ATPase [Chrysothrix sp. TS-e1954]|nr:MAG: regulatory particle non-ATPase [Chrysothrix sp. TS-e1954]